MLKVKRVQINELCAACNADNETVQHIFLQRPYAVSVWDKANFPQLSGNLYLFSEWLALVFQNESKEHIPAIIMICWMLWKNRNELIWNQRSLDPSVTVESAFSVLNQWRNVQDRTFDRFFGLMSNEDGDELWKLPLLNSVKGNTDAAIFEETGFYSYVFIARDHNGDMITAKTFCLRGRPSPEMAEALGIREALSWIKSADHDNVILESDCLQIIQAIRSSFLCFSYLGRVGQELGRIAEII